MNIFNCLLLLHHLRLLSECVRHVPLEFDVAHDACRWGILYLEAVGADKLIEKMNSSQDLIPNL